MFCSAPQIKGLQQQRARIDASAGEGLAAVCKLLSGLALFRKYEGFQRADKLVKTILTCCFPLALEQCLEAANDPPELCLVSLHFREASA